MTILVELLDEGTPTWYPVEAEPLGGDTYIITGANPNLEDLHWQFQTGTRVLCKPRIMSDGQQRLVAYEKLSN